HRDVHPFPTRRSSDLLRNEELTKHKDGQHWRFTDVAAGERGEMKVVLLGTIPYDHIDSVDWDGDEYYGFPHIYCFFAHKKEPYRSEEHTSELQSRGHL